MKLILSAQKDIFYINSTIFLPLTKHLRITREKFIHILLDFIFSALRLQQ